MSIKAQFEYIADQFERIANEASNGVGKTVGEAQAVEDAMARIISSCADIRDWTVAYWDQEIEIA